MRTARIFFAILCTAATLVAIGCDRGEPTTPSTAPPSDVEMIDAGAEPKVMVKLQFVPGRYRQLERLRTTMETDMPDLGELLPSSLPASLPVSLPADLQLPPDFELPPELRSMSLPASLPAGFRLTLPSTMPRSMTTKIDGVFTSDLVVGAPNADGEVALTLTVRRVEMTMALPLLANPMTVDTDKPADAQSVPHELVTLFEGLCGRTLTARYDRHGRALEVTGNDAIIKYLHQSNPMYAKQLIPYFGDEATRRRMLAACKQMIPNRSVGLGAKWKGLIRHELPDAGSIESPIVCTLLEIGRENDRPIVRVGYTGKPTYGKRTKFPTPTGVPVQIDRFEADLSGDYVLDADTGMFVRQTIDLTAEMEAKMPIAAMGKPITTKTTMHLVIEVAPVD